MWESVVQQHRLSLGTPESEVQMILALREVLKVTTQEALPPELQETDWLLSVPTRSLYTESLSAVVMKFLLWSLS